MASSSDSVKTQESHTQHSSDNFLPQSVNETSFDEVTTHPTRCTSLTPSWCHNRARFHSPGLAIGEPDPAHAGKHATKRPFLRVQTLAQESLWQSCGMLLSFCQIFSMQTKTNRRYRLCTSAQFQLSRASPVALNGRSLNTSKHRMFSHCQSSSNYM